MDIPRLCSREPCVIKRGAHKMVPQKSQGSASWSLVWLARDLQGVLLSRRLGAVSDGCHRGTLSPHVLVLQTTNYANNLFSSLSGGMFVRRLLVFLLHPKCVLVLGNDCERLCASRPLLGSYIHQESI